MVLYLLLNLEPGEPLARLERFLPRLAGAWGSLDLVQLRAKERPAGPYVRALELVLHRAATDAGEAPRMARGPSGLRRTVARGRPLVIANDRADVALAAGADGVHVGADDLAIAAVRQLPGGGELLVGATAHDGAELRRAGQAGADYAALGPFHPSPTKPGARGDPRGALRELPRATNLPAYAIGGLTLERLPELRSLRTISGVVVSSAIQRAADPAAAIAQWRQALDRRDS